MQTETLPLPNLDSSSKILPWIVVSSAALFFLYLIVQVHFQSVAILMMLLFALGLATATQVISYPMVSENNSHQLTAMSVSVVSFAAIGGYAIFQLLFERRMDLHWDGLIIHNEAIYSISNFKTALLILPIGFVVALVAALLLKEVHCQTIVETENES